MFESAIYFWMSFGAVLIFAELTIPGLVSVFVGLGALTVAAFLHFNCIETLAAQLTTWFGSSTIYIFSLRVMVMHYYPSDRGKQDIDEIQAMVGRIVKVVEAVSNREGGRIEFGESTWKAICKDDDAFAPGTKVQISGRENISWIVKKVDEGS